MTVHQTLLPPGWPVPKGYANGIAAEGRLVFVSGQVGWDSDGRFAEGGLVAQFRQTLENTIAVLREAGARPDVGNAPRFAQLCNLEPGEAVDDVDPPGALVDHGADRGALLGEQSEDPLQGFASGVVEDGRRVLSHSATRGATITQRRGSSPSL